MTAENMGVTYESCPACPDHPDGQCPMCGGEGYIEEALDPYSSACGTPMKWMISD